MRPILKVVVVWLALICLYSQVEASRLKVITEDFAPFNYLENKKVTGFTTEIVKELIKRTGVLIERDKILLWPWKRAYDTALNENNVLLFTTTRTPQRENLFNWVGPIYPREQWMFRLKSRKDIIIRSLEEAKQYKTVEVEDSANFNTFIRHGFEPHKNLFIVTTWDSKIHMLLAGRVDFASFLPLEMAYRMKQLGKKFDLVEKQFLISGEFKYYLAFSKGTSLGLVDKFKNAFNEMKQDGFYDKILTKYMN